MKNKFTKQLLIFTLIIVLSNAATYLLTVNGFLNFSSTQFIGVPSRLDTAKVKKLFEAENLINSKFYQKPDETVFHIPDSWDCPPPDSDSSCRSLANAAADRDGTAIP